MNSYALLSLIGIVIMLGGVATTFIILGSEKLFDFWLGFELLSIPLILGDVMLMIGIIKQSEIPNDEVVN